MGFALESAKLISKSQEDEYLHERIVTYICQGRRKQLDKYLNISKDIPHSKFIEYVINNKNDENLYNNNSLKIRDKIINALYEWIS